MKIKTIKLFLLVAVGLFLVSGVFFCSENVFAESTSYENYENIPGQEKTNSLVTYIENVYKFGIAIVAVLALFMIVLGSFNYIVTSAGNASKMGDAKDMILKAVEGLVLALAAYLILFIINPDLIGSTIGGTESVETKEDVYKETKCKSNAKPGYHEACTEEKCKDETEIVEKIEFKDAKEGQFNKACSDNQEIMDLFEKYGENNKEQCILKVIAHIESQCGQNKVRSDKDACGLMQIKISTARELDSGFSSMTDDEVCQKLKEDNDLSMKLASQYINKNLQNKVSKTLAGYNSGYGTSLNENGKKPSLASSDDCGGGALAFECCANPGDLDESIGYAWNGVGLYKTCMGEGNYKEEEL